jgi:hypothetical protein
MNKRNKKNLSVKFHNFLQKRKKERKKRRKHGAISDLSSQPMK